MPTTESLPIKSLSVDLKNFRTTPQTDEVSAVRAMISINPDWFWALMESLLEDGYHPTENIIVQKSGRKFVVREGNRRIGALKLIHGFLADPQITLPTHIAAKVENLETAWKRSNKVVPCAVYEESETELVDKVVALTHGKGEKAGRDKWNAVAKARHSRDKSGASEPALDLLEKYLTKGRNVTTQQAERWSGDYPLSVLDEAIKRIAPRLGFATSRALADTYPRGSKNREVIEKIISDVGLQALDFGALRNQHKDFAVDRYGVDPIELPPKGGGKKTAVDTKTHLDSSALQAKASTVNSPATAAKSKKTAAVAVNDPRSVTRALKAFTPKGKGRDKLVTLLEEIRRLKLDKHAHAFCFLLRSMFEISAKAYCSDHSKAGGPSAVKASGEDRALIEVLRDVVAHITKNNTDKQMQRGLHGAITELGNSSSILSVTSMNQLVHNPKFSINESHISALFGNIFPLLEEMNR
jgi:hypothetical protein